MLNSYEPCSCPTNIGKCWSYQQYYLGEKDEENRRDGEGINHWSGAESLENYNGKFLRDTMHGFGTYKWRHVGGEDVFATYEGHFYGNTLHGYGVMSYQNGNVFAGLFFENIRWGPGVQSQPCQREDVGLWRGPQLVRLAWMPSAPSVALDLGFGVIGKAYIDPYRTMLVTKKEIVGEVNSAIELMKQCGCQPMQASEVWNKLYPMNCNDFSSQLCNVQVFQKDYYDKYIPVLEEIDILPEFMDPTQEDMENKSGNSINLNEIYYAWNNNRMMIHMMKHCFSHEKQRVVTNIDLKTILIGPRSHYKQPGKHEIDCRTLLMASYLGHIKNVAQLVNECKIDPNVVDIQGNNAIMYAACGDQPEIIHFLYEAGGSIDCFNDNCCTPLGVALSRFACVRKDINHMNMVQALIPPPLQPAVTSSPPIPVKIPLEWNISRELPDQIVTGATVKTQGKGTAPVKKTKSTDDFSKKKASALKISTIKEEDILNDPFYEEKRLYYNINSEYSARVNELFSMPSEMAPVPYIFAVEDMLKSILSEEEPKKRTDKIASKSKIFKDALKASKSAMWKSLHDLSSSSVDKSKSITLSRIMSTIIQLLEDGANPRLVRCPQPALLIAVMSGSSELVQMLASHGADVNEVYPNILGYTALDVALSLSLANENVDIVRTLLENGAKTDYLLKFEDPTNPTNYLPGPTLLHAVLAKPTEDFLTEEIQKQLLEYLLQYGCKPDVIFNGKSAIDIAMDKHQDVFDIFIKCPRTNLNTVINSFNQTILVKMFSINYLRSLSPTNVLQMITNLLLFGADPFVECKNGNECYKNLFVYAKENLEEIDAQVKPAGNAAAKLDSKGKKPEKGKTETKSSPSKSVTETVGDYKQGYDFLVECSRTLLIRQLQGKLFKELLDVVKKYKHRPWNMIIPKHENKKQCSLWLTGPRCIEIWNIILTKKRQHLDKTILKHLLCIIELYYKRSNSFIKLKDKVTIEEKNAVEFNVCRMLDENKVIEGNNLDVMDWVRPYVMPELSTVKDEEKYNICFECLQPNEELEKNIVCFWCKLVWFCSLECMKVNIDRTMCHPCSEYLKGKYFPTPSGSMSSTGAVADVV